ncbi:MAG: hypothetical protein HIU92_20615 [Proteobacteria bacterium]|nr:hypothetical protein [Pseudomonadota bacterium]
MNPAEHTAVKVARRVLPPRDPSYWRRMIVIQRWRRITTMSCLLLALYALVMTALYPPGHHPGTMRLDESLLIFIIALVLAVNILTVAFRK